MNTITLTELKYRMDQGEEMILVNALEEAKFKARHIPSSLNLFTREGIESNLKKNDTIVVYCTDQGCNKSILLYHLLEALGYKHIYRFPGGLREWEEKGFPVEGEMVS